MGLLSAPGKGVHYAADVFRRQLIVVGHLDALFGGVDEQSRAVRLVFLQHHNAGGDTGAEKQIAGQLDHAVDEIVVYEILAYLLLCSAPIHYAGEADDCRRAVGGQPGQAVHDEGQVGLALGGQYPCGGKAGVIDKQGIVVPGPLDGVGRIGDYQLKGLVVPVLGIGQGILAGYVELVKAYIVEEHIDAAQVVSGDVYLLAVKAVAHCVVAQHLHRLQQQGARAAGRVIHLVHLGFAHGAQPGQQLGHIRRCKELTAGLACIAGVHSHQVFVSIAEGVNVVLLYVAQVHVGNAV